MRLYVLLLGAANQPLCEPVMVSTGVEGFAVVSARRVYKEIKGDCPPAPVPLFDCDVSSQWRRHGQVPELFCIGAGFAKAQWGVAFGNRDWRCIRCLSTSLGVIVGKSGIAYRRKEDGVYVVPITALRA